MSVPAPSESAPGYEYWAFISYSHQDNLGARADGTKGHIQWANWMHEQLETFVIPEGYRDRMTGTCEPMPSRFFPTFRDEAELPTSHDLAGQIRDALDKSRFLIVIASPRSACSRYVNEEVRYFRQIGRGNRILTLIVDGEPNVRHTPKRGWTVEDDCFCPALVHPLDDKGQVNEKALLPEEPIAADVRVKDEEPPREMRAGERSHAQRSAMLEFMKLKLIAGLMGVKLDELVQRDKVRQIAAARKRAATLRRWLAAVGLLAFAAVAGGIIACLQRNHALAAESAANAARDASQRSRSYAALQNATGLREVDNRQASLAYLAQALRDDRGNAGALASLASIVNNNIVPIARASLHAPAAPDGKSPCLAEWSKDGQRIVTRALDGTAKLWAVGNWQKPLAVIGGVSKESPPWVMGFSPDGKILAAIKSDQEVGLWEAATGAFLGALTPPTSGAKSGENFRRLEFSADGTLLAVGETSGDEYYTRIWNLTERRPIGNVIPGGLKGLAFSPDSQSIVVDHSQGVQIFDLAKSQTKLSIDGQFAEQRWTPDGRFVIAHLLDYGKRENDKIGLWDAATGELKQSFHTPSPLFCWSLSPSGTLLATGEDNGNVRIWSVASGLQLGAELKHPFYVSHLEFSPDGSRILVTCFDGTFAIWNSEGAKNPITRFKYRWEIGGENRSAHFSPDSSSVLTEADDGDATVWQVFPFFGGGITSEFHNSVRSVRTAAWSPDSQRVATGSFDSSARVWDVNTRQPTTPPLWHGSIVSVVSFSPDGRLLATGSEDQTVRIWNAATGDPMTSYLPQGGPVRSIDWRADGKAMLALSQNGNLRVWNPETGVPVTPVIELGGAEIGDGDFGGSASFSPDGRMIATAWLNTNPRLFDAQTGQAHSELPKTADNIGFIVYNHRGDTLATMSNFAEKESGLYGVQLWDARTLTPRGALIASHAMILSVEFSQDDRLLEMSGRDYAARILDAGTGQPIINPITHQGDVNTASFSSDGRFLVTASDDKSVRISDVATGVILNKNYIANIGLFARFSPDGRRILFKDYSAETADFLPSGLTPAWLPDLAEALAGMKLKENSTLSPLLDSAAISLQKLKLKLDQAPPDDWTRWAQWALQDRRERTISPFSSTRLNDYIEEQIARNTAGSLHYAANLAIGQPELLARIAKAQSAMPKR